MADSITTKTLRFNIETAAPGGFETINKLQDKIRSLGFDISNFGTLYSTVDEQFQHGFTISGKSLSGLDKLKDALKSTFAVGTAEQIQKVIQDIDKTVTVYEGASREVAKTNKQLELDARTLSRQRIDIAKQEVLAVVNAEVKGADDAISIEKNLNSHKLQLKQEYENKVRDLVRNVSNLQMPPEARSKAVLERVGELGTIYSSKLANVEAQLLSLRETTKRHQEDLRAAAASDKQYVTEYNAAIKEVTVIAEHGVNSVAAAEARKRSEVLSINRMLKEDLAKLYAQQKPGMDIGPGSSFEQQRTAMLQAAADLIKYEELRVTTAKVTAQEEKIAIESTVRESARYFNLVQAQTDEMVAVARHGADSRHAIEAKLAVDLIAIENEKLHRIETLRRIAKEHGTAGGLLGDLEKHVIDTAEHKRYVVENIAAEANSERVANEARHKEEIALFRKHVSDKKKEAEKALAERKSIAIYGEDSLMAIEKQAEQKRLEAREIYTDKLLAIERRRVASMNGIYKPGDKLYLTEAGAKGQITAASNAYVAAGGSIFTGLEEYKKEQARLEELLKLHKTHNKELLQQADNSARELTIIQRHGINSIQLSREIARQSELASYKLYGEKITQIERDIENKIITTDAEANDKRLAAHTHLMLELKSNIQKLDQAEAEHAKAEEARRGRYNKTLADTIARLTKLYVIWNSIDILSRNVRQISTDVPKTGIEFESTTASLTATTGSATAATLEFKKLREEAARTGIPIKDLWETFRGFSASTTLAGESVETTWKLFRNFNTAMVTLHMSGDNVSHTFLALAQMFNKGKIQSEELVKQLANYIPGAFASFATATGRSTAQLASDMKKGIVQTHHEMEKFSDFLANRFGGGAFDKARQGLNAAIGEYKSGITTLEEAIYGKVEPALKTILRGITENVNKLEEFVKSGDEFNKMIGSMKSGLEVLGIALAGFTVASFVGKLADAESQLGKLVRKSGFAAMALRNVVVAAAFAAAEYGISTKAGDEYANKLLLERLDTLSKISDEEKKLGLVDYATKYEEADAILKDLDNRLLEINKNTESSYGKLDLMFRNKIRNLLDQFKDKRELVIGENVVKFEELFGFGNKEEKETYSNFYRTRVSELLRKLKTVVKDEKKHFEEEMSKAAANEPSENLSLIANELQDKDLAKLDTTYQRLFKIEEERLKSKLENFKAEQAEKVAKSKAEFDAGEIGAKELEKVQIAAIDAVLAKEKEHYQLLQAKTKELLEQKAVVGSSIPNYVSLDSAIKEALISSVRFAESSSKTTGAIKGAVISDKGAIGPMQVMEDAYVDARKESKIPEADLRKRYQDIVAAITTYNNSAEKVVTDQLKNYLKEIDSAGVVYLNQLEGRFKSLKLTLAAYNMGPTELQKVLDKLGISAAHATKEDIDRVFSELSPGVQAYVNNILKKAALSQTLTNEQLNSLGEQASLEQQSLAIQTAESKATAEKSKMEGETAKRLAQQLKFREDIQLKLEAAVEALKESPESEQLKFIKEQANALRLITRLKETGTSEEKEQAVAMEKQYQLGLNLATIKGRMNTLQDTYNKLTKANDRQLAIINEKESSGNLDKWAAMQQRDELMVRQKESLAKQIATAKEQLQLGDVGATDIPSVKSNIEEWQQQLDVLSSKTSETGMFIKQTLQSSFANSFKDFITGAKSGSEAIKSFAMSVLDSVAEIMAQKAAVWIFGKLFGAAVTGGLSSIGGSTSFSASEFSLGSNSGAALDSFIPAKAKGGIFSNGTEIAFANGGIVSSPTLFPMAHGQGLMGEAGPEAIVPLKRGKDGKLGISGGGGMVNNVVNNISVTIEKYTGKDDPESMALKIAESISRKIAREEIISANRSGNHLRPLTAF